MEMTTMLEPTEGQFRVCEQCGTTFQLPSFRLASKFVKICVDCSEKQIESEREEQMKLAEVQRFDNWKLICPAAFLDTKAPQLPSPTKLDKVMKWKFGPRGLMLHGRSGAGKSRCAWELMKREWKAGRTISAIDSMFSFTYSKKYSQSPADVVQWMDRLMARDILLMDDVMKSKLTDSLENALFTVVNHRCSNNLPIIITTNDTPDTFKERMSEDRSDAMIRRLKEYCEPIAF